MKFIELAFRLGVVFAIFGFIWGIFQIGLALLRGSRPKVLFEEYSLKLVQYLFLVDVTFLFCTTIENTDQVLSQELILTGFVLLMYFIGKLQNGQNRMRMVQVSGLPFQLAKPLFNFWGEIILISLSIALFVIFIFFPDLARNPISIWFYDSILNIEDTPFFGFIFKVIGFFMLISLLIKMLNGLSFLLSGQPLLGARNLHKTQDKDPEKDDFDDFEEIQ